MWLFLTVASGHSMKWVWTCAVQRQCSIGGITGRDAAARWEAMYIEIHGSSGIWAEWVRLFSQQPRFSKPGWKNSTGDGSWYCASVMEKLTRMIPCEHCMHCIYPQQTAVFTSYERNRFSPQYTCWNMQLTLHAFYTWVLCMLRNLSVFSPHTLCIGISLGFLQCFSHLLVPPIAGKVESSTPTAVGGVHLTCVVHIFISNSMPKKFTRGTCWIHF